MPIDVVIHGTAGEVQQLSVFTFCTKDGTVKVELPDGVDPTSVRIGLEQDGETVKIVDSAGDWEVRLAQGQYDVRLLQGADQFLIENQTLVVESQQIASVLPLVELEFCLR